MFDDIPENVEDFLEPPKGAVARHSRSKVSMSEEAEHNLCVKWQFWHRLKPLNQEVNGLALDTMHLQNSFQSVESFWTVYNAVPKPSAVQCGGCLQVFAENEEPAAFNPIHRKGGKLTFIILNDTILDNVWERLVLTIVGGDLETKCNLQGMDDGRVFSGLVFGKRKYGGLFAVWLLQNEAQSGLVQFICRSLRRLCKIPRNIRFEFRSQTQRSDAIVI